MVRPPNRHLAIDVGNCLTKKSNRYVQWIKTERIDIHPRERGNPDIESRASGVGKQSDTEVRTTDKSIFGILAERGASGRHLGEDRRWNGG